jgi:hypothetical protein
MDRAPRRARAAAASEGGRVVGYRDRSIVEGSGYGEFDDELAQLLRAVERIADGVSGIQELAGRLAPPARPVRYGALATPESLAIVSLQRSYDHAVCWGVSQITISTTDAAALLAAIDRLRQPR